MAKNNGNSGGAAPAHTSSAQSIPTDAATTGAGAMQSQSGAGGINTPPAPSAANENKTPELVKASVRHKSPYPKYHRAGLAITNKFLEYALAKEQLAILERDPWIEVEVKKA